MDRLDSQGDINKFVVDFDKVWDEFKSKFDAAERDSLCALTPSSRAWRTKPDWDTVEKGFDFPEDDNTEYVDTTNQINHGVIPGSPIQPHCHIIQTHSGVPVFTFRYRVLNIGEEPTEWSEVDIDTPVMPWDPTKSSMVNIIKVSNRLDGALIKESTIIQGELRRKEGDGYSGDILVTDVDIHYLAGKIGKTFE